MKKLVNHSILVIIAVFFAACVFYPIYDREDLPGSILFRADHDCEIWLFDSDTIQIARDYYEVGKAPFIVKMKESGEYLVFAESLPARKVVEKTINYRSGHMEYYIEF